jgi:hypothetical protein
MKRLILTATVLGALAASAPAFAGNVAWGVSIGFGGGGFGGAVSVGTPCVAPARVACAPVYAPAPVVYAPAPVVYAPAPVVYAAPPPVVVYRPAVVAVSAPVVYGPVVYGAPGYRPVPYYRSHYRGWR